MSKKNIIVEGDSTSHGGEVLPGGAFLTIQGKKAALVGDDVYCPQCKGVFPIEQGTQLAVHLGMNIAVEGMETACGAELIASQSLAKAKVTDSGAASAADAEIMEATPNDSLTNTSSDTPPPSTTENTNQIDAQTPSQAIAQSGRADGRDTLVTYSDGTTERRSGGTLAWRNNNPGNIRAGGFANRNGAIGTGPSGFAIFPDEQTGNDAMGALLQTESYRDLNINDAVARYAPSVENDTDAYQRQLQRATGLDGSRIINSLDADELDSVVNAIRGYEGWREGTLTVTTGE